MLKLYNYELSGNCYKARLMLALLNLNYEIVPVDLLAREQKSPSFLVLNPMGQVPVLADGEIVLWDSQAILTYLAWHYGKQWFADDAEGMGKIVRWLVVAANEIQQSLAAARRHFLLKAPLDIELTHQKAQQVLQVIDHHLSQRQWLELNHPTIADIACFPYIHLASDARVSLAPYPQVLAWCDRIQNLPGYVPFLEAGKG